MLYTFLLLLVALMVAGCESPEARAGKEARYQAALADSMRAQKLRHVEAYRAEQRRQDSLDNDPAYRLKQMERLDSIRQARKRRVAMLDSLQRLKRGSK